MNFRLVLCALMVANLFILVSCKKDNDPPPNSAPTIVGFWKGKYGSGDATYPTAGYSFLFRSNGTIRVYNGADTATAGKAEGTYSQTGSSLQMTYAYLSGGLIYSAAGIMDTKCTFIEGTWGDGTSTTGGGRYFVNKQ